MKRRALWLAPILLLLLIAASLARSERTPASQRSGCEDQALLTTLGAAMEKLRDKPVSILALSGGGQFGAFGAGFLQGWRRAGELPKRPAFDMVTGTSTGALIATFAFLGTPEADTRIVQEYEAIQRDSDVFSNRFFFSLLWKDSLTTRQQFRRRLLDRVITSDVVRKVGEAAEDRLLLVGACDLESGCFRYFDLTALARRYVEPGATEQQKERIRQDYVDRLMASTAIPVQFPPVLVQEAEQARPSLYVDGGARRNLFIGPLMLAAARYNIDLSVFIIFNGERGVDAVDRSELLSGVKIGHIAGRSVSMLLDESTDGNLFRVFLQVHALKSEALKRHCPGCAEPKVTVVFTAIPPDVAEKCSVRASDEDRHFNNRVVRCLVAEGDRLGSGGKAWSSDPLATP